MLGSARRARRILRRTARSAEAFREAGVEDALKAEMPSAPIEGKETIKGEQKKVVS